MVVANEDTRKRVDLSEYSLTKLPPEADPAVGPFFYDLFDLAKKERDRLSMSDRWLENYRLFRGQHWRNPGLASNRMNLVTVNLFFANVTRSVANITASEPQAEVVDVTGEGVAFTPGSMAKRDYTQALTTKMTAWYNDTEQGLLLSRSALNMETYGTTIEKLIWNAAEGRPETVVIDPYSFFPAPGPYTSVNAMPFLCHAYPMRVSDIEAVFDVTGVEAELPYCILGEEREDARPLPSGYRFGARNYPSNYANPREQTLIQQEVLEKRALVIEVWTRDFSTVRQLVQIGTDPITNEPLMGEANVLKYPGGIRVVTLTNYGNVVLADRANPSVNPALPQEVTRNTYLYDHFPFFSANSYTDTSSFWGFSAAEQVGDLLLKIDELVSRISNYLGRLMLPTLIVPKDTGINIRELTNRPGLVLRPVNSVVSSGIRYIDPPRLPSNFLDLLNLYIGFFDRVSQIEDADRGTNPTGVIAASAIVALQERGAVLMRQKIKAMDYLTRERGRCALSYYQNFGISPEVFEVDGNPVRLRGVDLAAFKFNYIVESGSTVHRTSGQIQQQAEGLYRLGVIDRQALLEAVNYPGWREIVERVGEGQLGQALQILVQAGLPQEVADQLAQQLSQKQGGPGGGGSGQPGAPAQPGIPQSMQGQIESGSGA